MLIPDLGLQPGGFSNQSLGSCGFLASFPPDHIPEKVPPPEPGSALYFTVVVTRGFFKFPISHLILKWVDTAFLSSV